MNQHAFPRKSVCLAVAAVGILSISLSALLGSQPVAAQADASIDPAGAGFQGYLGSLRPRALAMGVSAATFDRVVPTLTYNPRVVQLDRNQADEVQVNPNAPISPFAPYRARHVDAARIAGGRAVYARERQHLAEIEARTGVPAGVVLGIYGHETNYGRITGNFDLLRSLSTLAYEGRRRSLFEAEFLAALLMVERGAPREALVGSWAGAFGRYICGWQGMATAMAWRRYGIIRPTHWHRSPIICRSLDIGVVNIGAMPFLYRCP
jgi:membrane-bound lytic murein transglycosylase B